MLFRSKYRTAIGKCFQSDDHSDRMAYGKAVKRHVDFLETIKIVNTLNERIKVISTDEILELVGNIADTIDRMVEYMLLGDDRYKVHAKIIRDMAESVNEIAKHVEFFSVYAYSLMSLTKALEDNAKRFETMTA